MDLKSIASITAVAIYSLFFRWFKMPGDQFLCSMDRSVQAPNAHTPGRVKIAVASCRIDINNFRTGSDWALFTSILSQVPGQRAAPISF